MTITAVEITAAELIDRVVEYCLTHTEQYSLKRADNSIKLDEDSDYWMVVAPDRIERGELLPGSDKHRKKRIEAWKLFARSALLVEPIETQAANEVMRQLRKILPHAKPR